MINKKQLREWGPKLNWKKQMQQKVDGEIERKNKFKNDIKRNN